MPAKSVAQRKFMGMVRATQKGEMDNPSPELKRAANDMGAKAVNKFAKTKEKNLPQKIGDQKESYGVGGSLMFSGTPGGTSHSNTRVGNINKKDKKKKEVKEQIRAVVEAKYEAGASTYGKATIRNKRKFGKAGDMPDVMTGKKINPTDETRGELILKRREEHKTTRGVKKESFSNWRDDLVEVMDTPMTEPEAEKKVDIKKGIKNKVTINPKLTETIKNMGGELLEVKKIEEGDGDPCWDSHKQVGMKKKGNKMVPNCVPKNEETEYTGPNKEDRKQIKKMDNPSYAKKLADYEKNMDPKKRQALKDKATKGMKFTHEEKGEVYWSSKALDQLDAINEKDTALDIVKKKIIAQYGKGAIMRKGSNQAKKVKGAKSTAGTNKYKDMADKKKETAADAKKRGFKSTQNYVDTMARYGGKGNYDKGKGLGT